MLDFAIKKCDLKLLVSFCNKLLNHDPNRHYRSHSLYEIITSENGYYIFIEILRRLTGFIQLEDVKIIIFKIYMRLK